MPNPTPTNYQRLSGAGYRQTIPAWAIVLLFFVIGIFVLLLRGRRVRLYLGDDHLLSVEWDGAKEYYKRFRYEDIQALVVRRTPDGHIMNIFLGFLAVVFYLIAAGVMGQPGWMWFWLVIGTLLLGAFVASLIAGPTCQCHLRTAVQTEELVSLGRFKKAERGLALLRERIVARQGDLTPEEIPARYRQFQEATAQRYVSDDPNAPPRMI